MDLKFFYTKQIYLLKQKIDHLTERDRILLLFIIGVILFSLWIFAIVRPEINSRKETIQLTQKIQDQTKILMQKKKIIHILISNPETVRIIESFKKLTAEIAHLDTKLTHYNERYITGSDLAKLLHDMLKQTMGVTIENFGTVVSPIINTNPPTDTSTAQTPQVQASTALLNLQTTHYRLIMRGTYFPIMRYLQRLEQLPWQLYWDKFDYTVAQYPEGIATVDFYTLKPQTVQLMINQGSKV